MGNSPPSNPPDEVHMTPEREGIPRWVRVAALVAIVVILLVVVVLVVVRSGGHTPRRHSPSSDEGTPAASVPKGHTIPKGHQPPTGVQTQP